MAIFSSSMEWVSRFNECQAHALAFGGVKAIMGNVPTPRLEVLCDIPILPTPLEIEKIIHAIALSDDIDAVLICTPTDTHADLIEKFSRAGKAIFCENPSI